MPAGPKTDWANPRSAETIPPPTIAITMRDVISFAFAGKRSIARPMYIPKLLAVKNATNATTDRNAKGEDTNGIAAVAKRPIPMHQGNHFAAEILAKTIAPANAAIVVATN